MSACAALVRAVLSRSMREKNETDRGDGRTKSGIRQIVGSSELFVNLAESRVSARLVRRGGVSGVCLHLLRPLQYYRNAVRLELMSGGGLCVCVLVGEQARGKDVETRVAQIPA